LPRYHRLRGVTTEALIGDGVLREVWRIKDELSASYGHDLNTLFAEARAPAEVGPSIR
jgi:hypothetical protein